MSEKLTLAEKVWRDHAVQKGSDGAPDLIYIDFQLLHEVTSPQAFDGLRLSGRPLRHPELHLATEDHNVPTRGIATGNLLEIKDEVSRTQVKTLRENCEEFGVRLHSMGEEQQGIVHTVGPQLGITQPGMTIVCGDSHTSTHGAFGSIAMGIGTSEVEHVMATQTLSLKPFKTMAVEVNGDLPEGVSAKDLILAIIAKIGTGGGQGYIIEYRGEAIRNMSMEARMTICNMSIEAGARAGMVAPDETTFEYVRGREFAPKGRDWEAAVAYWKTLPTDEGAHFDAVVEIDASELSPFVTWGTNPGQGLPLSANVPDQRILVMRTLRPRRKRLWPIWILSPARRCETSRSIPSSWARARMRESRICARPPRWLKENAFIPRQTCSWCLPLPWSRPKLKKKASTRFSRTLARSGVRRAAPCAWA